MQHLHWVMFCCFKLNVYYFGLLWYKAEACTLSNLYSIVSYNKTQSKKTEIVTMMSGFVGWISFMWHMKSDTWAWIYSTAHKHMLIFTIMQERSQLFPGDRWRHYLQATFSLKVVTALKPLQKSIYHQIIREFSAEGYFLSCQMCNIKNRWGENWRYASLGFYNCFILSNCTSVYFLLCQWYCWTHSTQAAHRIRLLLVSQRELVSVLVWCLHSD